MKKGKHNPRKKRPNPAYGLPGIETMLVSSVGPMILRQALGDATLAEIAVVATFLPTMLRMLQGSGIDAQKIFDEMYPGGVEINMGPGPYPVPANASDGSPPASPEVEKK